MTGRSRERLGPGGAPSRASALLFGLGLGGFIDGIVLHQILQWHHLISDVAGYSPTTLAGLEMNTLADGFFHLVTWLLVLAAVIVTVVSWRRGRLAPSWSFHLGLMAMGWGIFNVVEGVVDHHLLGIHHVRDDLGGPPAWDIGFLLFGAALIAGGWLAYRSGVRRVQQRAAANHEDGGPQAVGRVPSSR